MVDPTAATQSAPPEPEAEKPPPPPPPRRPEPEPELSQWQQIVAARRFTDCTYDPSIERWAKLLAGSPERFQADLARMQPYLDWVWREVRALGMPSEIAFLPLVESGYRQVYGSYGSPGGWWQLMPATAQTYGMSVNRGNDQRVDPVVATRAALKLSAENAKRFNNDWLLTIFAYNVGGQRVQRALQAYGLVPGNIAHVSELHLPGVTQEHLHRLIAWGCILADPAKYQVTLPPDLSPEQRFTVIAPSVTTPPAAIVATLGERGAEWLNQHPLLRHRPEIAAGLPLLAPADLPQRLAALGDLTAYRRPTPILGPVRAVPAAATRSPQLARTSLARAPVPAARRGGGGHTVRVKRGDSLWTIARRHDLRVQDLLTRNPGLTKKSVLRLGQRLRLQ